MTRPDTTPVELLARVVRDATGQQARHVAVVAVTVLVVTGTLASGAAIGADTPQASERVQTVSSADAIEPPGFFAIGVDERYFESFEDGTNDGWSGGSVSGSYSYDGDYTLYHDSGTSHTWTDGPSTSPNGSFNVTATFYWDHSITSTYFGAYTITGDIEMRISSDSSIGAGDTYDLSIRDTSAGITLWSWTLVPRGDYQRIKFSVKDGTIRGKKWDPSSSSEPSSWDYTADTDGNTSEAEFGWSGSGNNVEYSSAYLDSVEYRGHDHSFTNPVNGTVVTQNGDPVAGATVQVTTLDTTQYSASDPITAARDDIQSVTDPRPPSWEPNTSLSGADGVYQNTEAKYPVVVEKEMVGSTLPLGSSADLGDTTLDLPANTPLTVTAWDPTRRGRLLNQHEYDKQHLGRHLEGETVIFEKLAPSGEVVDTVNATTSQTYSDGAEGSWADPDKLYYDSVSLTQGYWRVRVAGTPASSGIVYQVGEPITAFRDSLPETVNGTTTDLASDIASLKNDGKIGSTITVTTDENGKWSADVPVDAEVVHIQASKANDPDLSTATLDDIENESTRGDLNGSIYLPSQPTIVEPPETGVTLTVHEAQYPAYGNVSSLEDKFEEWLDELMSDQFSELPPALQQRLENTSSEELQEAYSRLDQLTRQNEALEGRVETILAQQGDGEDVEVHINESDATDAELRERIQSMNQALTQLETTIEATNTETTASNGTVDSTATFDAAVNESQIAVFAHYTNGTTETVNESYISVDQSTAASVVGGDTGSTTVRVEDFPLPEDVAGVSFRYRVASGSGLGDTRTATENPAFSGAFPGLKAISCDTLAPGPSTNVSCELRPGSENHLSSLDGVTIFAPDGTEVQTTLDGTEWSWTTMGAGVYHVRLALTSTSGDRFVRTFQLQASSLKEQQPPSIMASSAPSGILALVGDGFDSGDIRVRDGGRSVTFVGTVRSASDAPGMVHVYGQGLSTASESTVDVRVTTDDGSSVNDQVMVVYHGEKVPDDLNTYRVVGDDADPITEDGGSAGYLNTTENGTTWVAPTGPHGAVGFETRDPGWWSWDWFMEHDLGIENDGVLLAAPPVTLAVALVVVRRRRKNDAGQDRAVDGPVSPLTPGRGDAGADAGTEEGDGVT